MSIFDLRWLLSNCMRSSFDAIKNCFPYYIQIKEVAMEPDTKREYQELMTVLQSICFQLTSIALALKPFLEEKQHNLRVIQSRVRLPPEPYSTSERIHNWLKVQTVPKTYKQIEEATGVPYSKVKSALLGNRHLVLLYEKVGGKGTGSRHPGFILKRKEEA